MEKEFIPYEEALVLRELGFDEPCFGWYEHNGNFYYCYQEGLVPPSSSKILIKGCCLAPLYQQAFRWFRNKGKKLGLYDFAILSDGTYQWYYLYNDGVERYSNRFPNVEGTWSIYEGAELACLRKLIEITKT